MQLRARMPTQAGRRLFLGLSTALRPGIPLRVVPGIGTELLPLKQDALLSVSLQIPLTTQLDATGQGSIMLRMPNDPYLLWFPFHAAGFTLTASTSVGAITNPVFLEVVR